MLTIFWTIHISFVHDLSVTAIEPNRLMRIFNVDACKMMFIVRIASFSMSIVLYIFYRFHQIFIWFTNWLAMYINCWLSSRSSLIEFYTYNSVNLTLTYRSIDYFDNRFYVKCLFIQKTNSILSDYNAIQLKPKTWQ